MNRASDLINLYEDKISSSTKEMSDLVVASKHDAGDLAENTGQVAINQKIFEMRDDISQMYEYIKFLKKVRPISDNCICLGSWFHCNFNGVDVDAMLSYYTDLDYLEKGIAVFDIESKVGKLLCGQSSPNDIIFSDAKLTNIKIK